MIFLRSICRIVLNDENKKDTKHMHVTNGKTFAVKVGSAGIIKRMNPIPPSLRSTPAKRILPAVGAATWASGNQRCTGIRGIFTEKTAKKPHPKRLCLSRLRTLSRIQRI